MGNKLSRKMIHCPFMNATIPHAVKLKLNFGSSVSVDSANKYDTVELFVKRETGLHTRSTAKKRQSRELVMMCIQTARLQQLSSYTIIASCNILNVSQFTRFFCVCLIAAFLSMNQYLRMCHLFKVISVIYSVYLY